MVEKYQDNLSWVHGKHTIVVGADMQFYQNLRIMVPVSLNGSINYNGQYSSLANEIPDVADIRGLADLMLGYPSGGNRTQRFTPNNWVGGGLWNYYAQDDIKLTSNLTVNLGIRYEYRRLQSTRITAWSRLFRPGKVLRTGKRASRDRGR